MSVESTIEKLQRVAKEKEAQKNEHRRRQEEEVELLKKKKQKKSWEEQKVLECWTFSHW